ncbi:MAG: hypothetical protein J6P99_02645, partial [Paludibacteraceae bacterium]|nr:hypothetical protein [Paludibacteraceae bacterium]
TASFEEILYDITITSNNAAYGDVNPKSAKAGITTTVNITATPEQGYEFVKWSAPSSITLANANSASTTITKATAKGTVSATFQEKKHDVIISYKYGNTSLQSDAKQSVGEAKATSITALSITGYTFTGWTLGTGIVNKSANTTDNPISITTNSTGSGYTLTANYTKNVYTFTLMQAEGGNATATVNGNSINSSAMLDHGTKITLTATVDDKYKFSKWVDGNGTDLSTDNPYTHSLTAHTTIKAVFINTNILYLKPNSNWKSDNAWFAACFCKTGSSEQTWVKMKKDDPCGDNGYYRAKIPAGNWDYVIFCRMDGGKSDLSWDSKWNQTGDLTIPTDGKNCFTLADGVWDGATTTWGTYNSTHQPLVYNVTVPTGTPNCYIIGNWDGWKEFIEMTKVDDTHYTVALLDACSTDGYKYCYGPGWGGQEVNADFSKSNDRTYSANDEVKAWIKYRLVGYGGNWEWNNGFEFDIQGDMKRELDQTETHGFKIVSSIGEWFTTENKDNDKHIFNRNHNSEKIPETNGEYHNLELNVDKSGTYYFHFYPISKLLSVEFTYKGYRVKITMGDTKGTVYTSNEVDNAGETLSFFAPGTNETGDRAGKVELLHDGVVVANIDASLFTKSDVYVAKLNSKKDGITDVAIYTGDFYIRTDMAPGGWNSYKQASNAFTHFNKYDDETFNHYWIEYTHDYKNLKAHIANDYNPSLATELDDFHASQASVRFSYNNETNAFERAILRGSAETDEFLRLLVDNADFSDGTTFGDISNWVYEITLTATAGQIADIAAKHPNYNNHQPYLLRDDVKLLGNSSSTGQHTIRVIYDFKKNRMICGWLPGDLNHDNGELISDADMLVVRVDNKDASTINMKTAEDKISDLNRLYFVLELTRDEVINKKTNIFWFSLPFECKLKDVFGIEGYGTKWVVQRYRGDKRAELGFRPEIETFWANMKQSNTATLEPNRGYVLSLNLKESDFKEIEVEEGGNKYKKSLLRLYFPSNATEFTLSQSNNKTVEVPEHLCEVNDPKHNRKPLDSHWNVIGIPGYQPVTINENDYEASYPGGGYYPPTEEPDDPTAEQPTNGNYAPKFLYTWNGTKDDYTVQDGTSFTYKHFYSYMVQFAGTINWSQYTQNTPNPSTAPRRVAKKADKMYKVLLAENGENRDQTFITLSEKGNHEYTIGNDLEKIGSTSVARIYTQEGNWNLAANYLSDTTTVLPLTLSIPAEGEYTLSLEQGRYSSDALLYDRATGTYTDLSKEAYTFTAEAGVDNERFALRFAMKLPGNPTDLQQTQAQYLVRTEGKRIIIEGMAGDVRLYDMTGRIMTQQQAIDYTEITVPVTGVYVLQVGNQFEKMIIK